MAKCEICEQKFGEKIFCSFEYVIDEDEILNKRVPATQDCKTCKVSKGKMHHLGCKSEVCPLCGEIDNTKCEHLWTNLFEANPKHKNLEELAYRENYPRLILLTILTAGLYPFFWIYKTWRYIVARQKLPLNPLVLTLLWPIYLFLLVREIKKIGEEYYLYRQTNILIPIIFILIWTAWIWDSSFLWLILFSFIPIVNLEEAMRKIYRRDFLK